LQLRTPAHRLQGVGLVPVGRAGAAGLDIGGGPSRREEANLNAGRAVRLENRLDVVHGASGPGDVEPGQVEVPASRGVGVLHVDHDYGGLGWNQGVWLWAR